MGLKNAVGGLQSAAADFADQGFGFAAVLDQVGDGANLQAMLGCKQLQIGQAGHGAVVLHDFADHAAGVATGHAGQVATRFGVAGAHQHAAIHRLQGKHMAGLNQVLGAAVGGHRDLHGARPVGRRNAGGDTLGGLDGHGEGGAVGGAVAHRHGWQAQVLAALAREGQANQATAKAGHEVDGLGAHVVGGEHQVAFVFAVFFVDQDHHAASAQLGHDVFNRGDGYGFQSCIHGWGGAKLGSARNMRST